MNRIIALVLVAPIMAACGGGGGGTPALSPKARMEATVADFCAPHGGVVLGIPELPAQFDFIQTPICCTDGRQADLAFKSTGEFMHISEYPPGFVNGYPQCRR